MTKLNEITKIIMETDTDVFTFEHFINLGFPKTEVARILSLLVRHGVIYKVRRGIYSKKPVEEVDVFKLAQTVFPGYLGFSVACYIYGWLEYFPFTIYVVTVSTSKQLRLKNFLIKAVALKQKAIGSTRFKDYLISTKGKTLFDILYKPGFVGGYNEVVKILKKAKLSKDDLKEFVFYAKKFGSKSFMQKSGYLLSRVGIHLDELHVEHPAVAVIPGKSKGRFNKEWMIIDKLGADYE